MPYRESLKTAGTENVGTAVPQTANSVNWDTGTARKYGCARVAKPGNGGGLKIRSRRGPCVQIASLALCGLAAPRKQCAEDLRGRPHGRPRCERGARRATRERSDLPSQLLPARCRGYFSPISSRACTSVDRELPDRPIRDEYGGDVEQDRDDDNRATGRKAGNQRDKQPGEDGHLSEQD